MQARASRIRRVVLTLCVLVLAAHPCVQPGVGGPAGVAPPAAAHHAPEAHEAQGTGCDVARDGACRAAGVAREHGGAILRAPRTGPPRMAAAYARPTRVSGPPPFLLHAALLL